MSEYARSTFSFGDPGIKTLLGLETDLEHFYRVTGPRAVVMTLNRLRKKIRTDVTNKVWQDARYLPLVDSKGRKVGNKKISTGVKRDLVFRRVHTGKATRHYASTKITGYVKDIPLTSLGVYTRKTNMRTLTTKVHYRKTVGKRAKVQQSTLGGMTIGGQFLIGAFIQATGGSGFSGPSVHAFRRDNPNAKKATWQKGHHGWSQKKGDPSGGLGKVPPRAPYSVLKVNLKTSFDKHFVPTVAKTVEDNWSKEHARSLTQVANRILDGK